jgi:integrase
LKIAFRGAGLTPRSRINRGLVTVEHVGRDIGVGTATADPRPFFLSISRMITPVKQQLAAVRMLFDWLITGQIMPVNPASAVRGPKRVVKTGKTPVLEGQEWRKLIDAIPTDTVRDLRDRALIATFTYCFARVGAALKMRVEDLQSKGSGWLIRLHEKGGKQHKMPCHHALAERCRLYRRGWHRRGQERISVPYFARPRRNRTRRSAHDPGRCLANGAQARARRRHHGADRQSLIPGNRDHGVPC